MHSIPSILFITDCHKEQLALKEAQKLVKQGEEMIYCLRGGIASWTNANLPLTKG